MTTTPTPSPDAVEALCHAIWPHVVRDDGKPTAISIDVAKTVMERLQERGYTITRAEPAPLPDDISIDNLIKQLDMGEPDPSDYEVTKHLFDAQDRHRAAMSAIKVRLLCIKSLRAHIASLGAENKRLRDGLERIAQTHFCNYDGSKPFISEHDSGYLTGVRDGHRLASRWAKEALAQPDPQKCGTCGGTRLVKSETSPCHVDCPDCNGTGKAGA